jgi:hypothetical protein
MSTILFENAKYVHNGQLRPTKLTDGLLVSGEVKGYHLSQALGGIENLETINVGYAQIFSATDKYFGKPIIGMTEAKGKVKTISRSGFRWELSGGNVQKARITQTVCTDNRPGLYLQPFDIIVDKPWFNVSDIIIPQHNQKQCRVMPYGQGQSRAHHQVGPNAFRYTIQYITNNPNEYLDSKYIQEGHEWCKVSSAVATEDNIDGGGFQFYSIFESEGQLQQHAVHFGVSDKVARRAKQAADGKIPYDEETSKATRMLWVKYEDKVTGQPLSRFMALLDAEAFNELYQNCEWTLIFGKLSNNMVSPEGHQILTASGLRQQLESGWTLEHNGSLSLEELEDWFDSIIKDKISEGEQKVVMSAGRQFRKIFDQMIKVDARTYVTVDSLFLRKGSNFRDLDYGSYFANYKGFTCDISVMENPSYDNQYYCPQMHPTRTNFTIDSWRADILDFGTSKQQGTGGETDNISMVQESYCNYNITYNGKWYGAHDGKSGMPITDGGLGQAGGVSGYSVHREKSCGLMIADVTRCGAIYLSIND